MVMGFNHATAAFFDEYRTADGSYEANACMTMSGDSTVPLASGDAVAKTVDQMYWVDESVTNTDHGGYGSSADVQNLVLQLLNGQVPGASAPIYTDEAALPQHLDDVVNVT